MTDQILKSTKIKTLVFLHCLLAVSVVLIVFAVIRVDTIIYRQNLNYSNHIRYHIANSYFRQGTDALTNAVRRYVVTTKPEYMDQYFHESQVDRHRNRALEMVRNLRIDRSLKATLTDAMRESKGLMLTEYRAMHIIAPQKYRELIHNELGHCPMTDEERKLPAERRHEMAEKLLWDDAYVETKDRIYSHLAKGLKISDEQAKARQLELRKELLRMLTLSAASLIAMVLAVCGFFFYRRRQHEYMIEVQAEENARMNAQLKAERDKAIKAEKARSYFFSTVSHDIRTPLNSIIGFSEMLQLGIDDPEERERALDAIITSGQTLLELINDVLDLSKLESGKMELHPVPTNIAELVRKVAASFKVATSRTSVPIRTEIGKMPFLKLDPQRIRQILFNLIGNAVKFTAKGSITVRAAYADGVFTLAVADTGCGISKENIGKLMSPYVQLQEHDATMGTGLGLAICKQLSQQMKGTLEIESTEGKGSTFTLRIPNVPAFTEQESEAFVSEQKASAAATQLDESITEKRILVVDDQTLNQRILQTMLARLGIHKTPTAGNGREALEMLNECGDVDIVLTDMSMPVMDGAELVREIRKAPHLAETAVYMITADVEMQSEYRKLGFDDLLIKPVTLEKLKELLAKYAPHRPPETTD